MKVTTLKIRDDSFGRVPVRTVAGAGKTHTVEVAVKVSILSLERGKYNVIHLAPGNYIFHKTGKDFAYAVTSDTCECMAFKFDKVRFPEAPRCKHTDAARELASQERTEILKTEYPSHFTHWTEEA